MRSVILVALLVAFPISMNEVRGGDPKERATAGAIVERPPQEPAPIVEAEAERTKSTPAAVQEKEHTPLSTGGTEPPRAQSPWREVKPKKTHLYSSKYHAKRYDRQYNFSTRPRRFNEDAWRYRPKQFNRRFDSRTRSTEATRAAWRYHPKRFRRSSA